MNWQLFETAKAGCVEGTDYLVGNHTDGVWVATWRTGPYYPDGAFFAVSGYWASCGEPTHWQLLPEPPDA